MSGGLDPEHLHQLSSRLAGFEVVEPFAGYSGPLRQLALAEFQIQAPASHDGSDVANGVDVLHASPSCTHFAHGSARSYTSRSVCLAATEPASDPQAKLRHGS